MKIDGHKLFDRMFKNGDQVVIITENDLMDYGKLYVLLNSFTLTQQGRKPKEYPWNQVVFMAHDGFPVKKVRTYNMYGEIDIDRVDTSKTLEVIRQINNGTIPLKKQEWELKYPGIKNKCYAQIVDQMNKSFKEFGEVHAKYIYCDMGCHSGWEINNMLPKIKKYLIFDPSSPSKHFPDKRALRFGDPFDIENVSVELFNPGNSGRIYEEHPYEEFLLLDTGEIKAMLYHLPAVLEFV